VGVCQHGIRCDISVHTAHRHGGVLAIGRVNWDPLVVLVRPAGEFFFTPQGETACRYAQHSRVLESARLD
jgi:hypothetical protein